MLLYTEGVAPALLFFWRSQHRYLKHVMEVAETVQLMLPGVGGKCLCDPFCEWILSAADD